MGADPGWKTTLTLAGTTFGGVAMLQGMVPFGPWWAWIGGAAVSAGGVVLVRHRGEVKHIAADWFDDEPDSTTMQVPATEPQIRAANAYSRKLYGREALDVNDSLSWWRRNPYGYFMLISEQGDYLGNVGAPPISKEGEAMLLDGQFEEKDLTPDHFLPVSEMAQADTVYLASIAVKRPGTDGGKARAAQLIAGTIEVITRLYKRPMRIVAIAATPEGERLLRGSGGKVICAKEGRKDNHNVYEILPDADRVEQMRARAARRAPAPTVLIEEPSKTTVP